MFERFRHFSAALTGKSFGLTTKSWLAGDTTGSSTNRLVQPYAQSAWIRSAVNHISGEISGRPLDFYAGEVEFEDAALAAWWAKPALGPKTLGVQPRMPLSDVLRDLSSWASLEGEFFLCLDDSWLLATARGAVATMAPFLIANPQRMRLIVSGGTLQGYEYTDSAGRRTVMVPEQVYHWKCFNPYDDWRGVGGLQAASVAAEGAFATGVYIRDLMRNNGDQGYIVIGKNGVVQDAQREAIVADLRAKRAALQRGVAKDLFLTGDITVERPSEQAASTDLTVGKSLSHQEIYVAFGVPPSMAEVKASYSIGKESDYYQLITRTCQPQGHAIASTLASIASRQTGRELTAELDWDDHPVMLEVRNSRLDAALKLWGIGMPMSAANDYFGLGMKPFPGWEIGYLPFSVAPVSSDTAGATPATKPAETDPALAETTDRPEDPAVQQLRLVLMARKRVCKAVPAEPLTGVMRYFTCSCHGEEMVNMKDRSEADQRLWKSHMATRVEVMKGFESAIRRVLNEARAETLANLDSKKALLGAQTKAAAADIVFDKSKFKAGLLGIMRKREKAALETAGQQLYKELGKDDTFKYPPAKAVEVLNERENRLGDASDAIHDSIKGTLTQGLQDGDTMEQLAARVRTAFNGIADGRARTIAATEVAVCYGVARNVAMVEAGVPYKQWLTSGNGSVRSAHAAANGQTVGVDEAFIVDGEELQHPGDSNGSAGNVINCHCVSIAKAEK